MKLTLAFELDVAGLVQPKGTLVMDVDFYASGGKIHADIREIEVCDSGLYTTLGQKFGKTLLADEIARVINQVIEELPQRLHHLGRSIHDQLSHSDSFVRHQLQL